MRCRHRFRGAPNSISGSLTGICTTRAAASRPHLEMSAMAMFRTAAVALAAFVPASVTTGAAAPRKLVVGIPPFDVAAVDGDASAGQVLSKLIRIEMTKNVRLQP